MGTGTGRGDREGGQEGTSGWQRAPLKRASMGGQQQLEGHRGVGVTVLITVRPYHPVVQTAEPSGPQAVGDTGDTAGDPWCPQARTHTQVSGHPV